MPSQLFYTTQIPVSLWFLSRNKTQKNKTLFIDARNMGTMINRTLRMLDDNDIVKIAKTFDAFRAGKSKDSRGFSAVVDTETIASHNFILTPGRYVGAADIEEDAEPFDKKISRLTNELNEMFNQSHKLEKEIKKQLETLGSF
jgi:type I restriction enzyme M protein